MHKFLFLDFDGVLHPDGEPDFCRRELFEQYLLAMPEVRIVISSTWREDYPLPALRNIFCPSLQDRILGVTPVLEVGFDRGGRQREIEAWLSSWDMQGRPYVWVALDDWRPFFDEICPELILVDACTGFREQDGQQLLSWYQGVSGNQTRGAV